jgi:adenylosuccinate synthase
MLITDVVVGLQHGDEGKGKVCYNLLKQAEYNISVRFNGGPNAGHTIKDVSLDVVLHQLPCGVLFNKTSIIGSNCVIDISKLLDEINYLEMTGYKNIKNHLFISHNAHIIENKHIIEDKKKDSIGTTQSGIGPCYMEKVNRTGKRAIDFKNVFDEHKIKLINPLEYFYNLRNEKKTVLCEGAQGFKLDIDQGDYPYCTSSSCLIGAINTTGIPINSVRNVYGCCKIYDTYVGSKNFEPNDNILKKLGDSGKEFGSTTGRKRQCNWLNMSELKHSIFINGCTHIIINKCDIFEKNNIFKVENIQFDSMDYLKEYVKSEILKVDMKIVVIFSGSPYII